VESTTLKKTVATDKEGNNVQVTYNITDAINSSFTINACLTKCTLLINGKNTNRFESKELYSLSSTISVAFATFFIIILIFRSGIMIIS
jgi:hypothetical protein